MFNPGLGSDKLLVQTRYAEMLDQSAAERAQQRSLASKFPTILSVTAVVTLAIAMPILFWLVWVQMAG